MHDGGGSSGGDSGGSFRDGHHDDQSPYYDPAQSCLDNSDDPWSGQADSEGRTSWRRLTTGAAVAIIVIFVVAIVDAVIHLH